MAEWFNLTNYVRIVKLAHYPTQSEFSKVAAISAIGVGFVGLLGTLIFVVMGYLPS